MKRVNKSNSSIPIWIFIYMSNEILCRYDLKIDIRQQRQQHQKQVYIEFNVRTCLCWCHSTMARICTTSQPFIFRINRPVIPSKLLYLTSAFRIYISICFNSSYMPNYSNCRRLLTKMRIQHQMICSLLSFQFMNSIHTLYFPIFFFYYYSGLFNFSFGTKAVLFLVAFFRLIHNAGKMWRKREK